MDGDRDDAGQVRPRRLPRKPRIRVDDESADDDGRDIPPEDLYPAREPAVLAREQEKRQGAERVVHGKANGNDAQHVDDLGFHFFIALI